MAVEPRRGCGYRKVGGLYLVSGELGAPCCKLPVVLTVCPCCGAGIKQSRGWQWVDPRPWLQGACSRLNQRACPASDPEVMGERVGLLWVGTAFYPTPEHFQREAQAMGVSRRIQGVPRGFRVGETWVFLAHPRVRQEPDGTWRGGIFRLFRPTAIEIIVTDAQMRDPDFAADLERRHLTPVVVPEGDPDHRGTVYDEEEEPALI